MLGSTSNFERIHPSNPYGFAFAEEAAQQEPVRVCLRLRPANKFELARRSTNCITSQAGNENGCDIGSHGTGVDSFNEGDQTIKINSPPEGEFHFVFDKVFHGESTQLFVYQHFVAPLASSALEGFSCALIAYGQTGSGKTHTMMGGYEHIVPRSPKNSKARSEDDKPGMIHLLIRDVFRLIKESPPTAEFIVRCSFVEIYLERIIDLLNPTNRSIQILSGKQDGSINEGVRLHGASEACCFDESDVISLLVRGNACRTVSSTKMNLDSSRSHAIFIVKIEQKDRTTGISKVSQVNMIDMAGSELGGKGQMVVGTEGSAIHQEARMINKSISLLHTVVKTIVDQQDNDKGKSSGGYHESPHRKSKLTHILRDTFGGNCRSSVILTASPASYNISETLRTMKFGCMCKNVKNFVKPNVEISPLDYRKLLNDSQKKQGDLANLVNELSAECFQLKQDATNKSFVESSYNGPLWRKIEAILVNGASPVVTRPTFSDQGLSINAEKAALERDSSSIRAEVERVKQAQDSLEILFAERQSEVAVLRTQNDIYASEKKKHVQEYVAVKNEMRALAQRKQEVEHNLRTSQFREYEATVFLRQFRRFYRRLLRNKAHQGTGRTAEVIERVPGVPDLNDLIDVDSLLLEAGLIEETELHDDTATGAYRPSAQALSRSTDATNKAWKEAASHGKVGELESFDHSSLVGKRVSAIIPDGGADAGAGSTAVPHGQSVSNRQQFLGTPAGRLTTMRERELERDLLRATERCIELQVALNEEKANVDVLTNRAGNVSKKKYAQESIQLKQQLDKKTHDLQAIIWKMNELHLINKTYNEKMSNREQHVSYLEENLVELQSSNRNMILERQEAEAQLRQELDNLKVLVDAMTVPLWQFGECGVTGRTLSSRIHLPVCGGEEIDNGHDSENVEESVGSFYEDEEDESEYENEMSSPDLAAQFLFAQGNPQVQDAFTQTCRSSLDKGTMTDESAPQHPLHCDFNVASTSQNVMSHENMSSPRKLPISSHSIEHGTEVCGSSSGHSLLRCGMTNVSFRRIFVQKYGLAIRPGVLKESSPKVKPEKNVRSVNASYRFS